MGYGLWQQLVLKAEMLTGGKLLEKILLVLGPILYNRSLE